MFGMNEKVGRSFFKEQPDNTLQVTSRFYTLQGEGPYRGMPAYFIRLTKCNLDCSFCDTYFDKGENYTFSELFEQADRDIERFYEERQSDVPKWARGKNKRIVLVITGGEPTLQLNLAPFLDMAQQYFKFTQIESNGILPLELPDTTYVVSPKCVEKNGEVLKYIKPHKDVLEIASCLKFVMNFAVDKWEPYCEVPEWAHEWAEKTGRDIYVSPMNVYKKEPQKAKEMRASNKEITIEERSKVDETISFWEPDLLDMKANQINHERTAEYAMKHGFILNLQTHLYASLP